MSRTESLPRMEIKGNRFVSSKDGHVFLFQGVTYQPTVEGSYEDVISNDHYSFWEHDIEQFRDLGVNVIRVYETDPVLKHDRFMGTLNENRIYLLLDLQSKHVHIDRNNPSYTVEHFEFLKSKIDAFIEYDNVIGFIIGNEVANAPDHTTEASAYIKAMLRDVKNYMRQKKKRVVPVGYAAADVLEIRKQEAAYYACESDSDGSDGVDFYALNVYSWCGGEATYETSGWREMVEEFSNLGVPVILGEYGCNLVRPRMFNEVKALYSTPMMEVFSGGIVYEYSEEQNRYGLVQIDSSGNRRKLQDYQNLKKALGTVSVKNDVSVKTDLKRPKCPEVEGTWIASSKLPPTPSKDYCECIIKSLSCHYSGDSSADVGKIIEKLCSIYNDKGTNNFCDDTSFGNATKGTYSTHGFCSPEQKLSILLNKRYQKESQCIFDGVGTEKKPSTTAQSCASKYRVDYNSAGTTSNTLNSWIVAFIPFLYLETALVF
ncbi:hypothetical protein MP638_000321 [Amoeboaphelidium occidentale]|nr:hypothetical protein MP638_000321 [Amoeboaphelidium occidentale]